MSQDHPLLRRKKLNDRIRRHPRDAEARKELVQWYRQAGRHQEADAHEWKAIQAEHFDPDYNYHAKVDSNLKLQFPLVGWVVCLLDPPYTYWCDPVALQSYLETTPPGEMSVRTLSFEETQPPQESLARAFTASTNTPTLRFPEYTGFPITIKAFPGDEWIAYFPTEKAYHYVRTRQLSWWGLKDVNDLISIDDKR